MSDPHAQAPDSNTPARRFGAPRHAGVPGIEDVRVTAPDLTGRAALEKTRGRIVIAAAGFSALFAALGLKLALATIVLPMQAKNLEARQIDTPVPPATPPMLAPASARPMELARAKRAMITDRNGEVLALSLPTAAVIANPRALVDPADAAHKLKLALPRLDEQQVLERLSDQTKQFVYLARQVTPREQLAINAMGIPGVDFERTERRRYPLGRVAAQVLGGVDVDGHGSLNG